MVIQGFYVVVKEISQGIIVWFRYYNDTVLIRSFDTLQEAIPAIVDWGKL